jgi:autotransporter passenger strand-loop-strand repeat protein
MAVIGSVVKVPQPFPALNILSAAVIDGFAAGDTIAVTGVPLGPGPVGVALMSGVLQLAANGFLFERFAGKILRRIEIKVDYFIALSQTIISTGTAFISAGQTGSGIDVVSGGTLVVSGGTALATTVGGGLEIVSSGGLDSGAQMFGGEQDVFGTAGGGSIFDGSQVIEGGGTASNTTIANGGTLVVSAGGLADPTTILGGGLEIISTGSDRGALLSGGEQDVYGNAGGATIFAGSQVIESGGGASNTTVAGGGTLDVLSGGSANSARISAGGTEAVSARPLRTPGRGFRAARSWSTGSRAGR